MSRPRSTQVATTASAISFGTLFGRWAKFLPAVRTLPTAIDCVGFEIRPQICGETRPTAELRTAWSSQTSHPFLVTSFASSSVLQASKSQPGRLHLFTAAQSLARAVKPEPAKTGLLLGALRPLAAQWSIGTSVSRIRGQLRRCSALAYSSCRKIASGSHQFLG